MSLRLPALQDFGIPTKDLQLGQRGRDVAPWLRGGPPNVLVSAAQAELHERNGVSAILAVRERSSHQLRESFIADTPALSDIRSRSSMLAERKDWTARQNLKFQDTIRISMPRGRTLGAPGKNPNVRNFNHLETFKGRGQL